MTEHIHEYVRQLERGCILLFGTFATNASGAVTSSSGKGIASVAKSAEGTYRVTLDHVYNGVKFAAAWPRGAAFGRYLQASAFTPASKQIDFMTQSGGDDRVVSWKKDADDGAAGDATASRGIFVAPQALVVTAATFVAGATGVTADNTNYATLLIEKRAADGSTNVTVASITTEITGSGDIAAHAAVALTNANLASRTLAAGETLHVSITKAASGVVVPAGALSITYKDFVAKDIDSATVDFMAVIKRSSAP